MLKRRTFNQFLGLGGVLGTAVFNSSGWRAASAATVADNWPSKAIRLIVPFAAGGGNDTVARAVSEKLSLVLGQRVIVDNKGGAGGALGAELAAKAEPDGYTLFLGGVGSLAINPATREKSSYDPIKDFSPICSLDKSS